MAVGHIREVHFPNWSSNIVLVLKSTSEWKMCMDFHDLNKAFSKDCYLLYHINKLVDSIENHEFIFMMNTYQGYHQIPLAKANQEKVLL